MMAEAKIPRFELDSADNKKADVKCELKVFVVFLGPKVGLSRSRSR